MKTFDELKRTRDTLKRRLQDAYEALAQRGGMAAVSAAAQARFEETCQPRPSRHQRPLAQGDSRRDWTRC
jgi:hypothetical protein